MSFEAKTEPSPAAATSPAEAGGLSAGQLAEPGAVTGPMPHLASPAAMSQVQACRIVRHLVDELLMLIGDRVQMRRDRRRALCHIRQIAMYVCHVSLGIAQSDIGEAFGRDRTTVGHACAVVEERRENAGFDDFVSTVERIANTVFGRSEAPRHD